MPTQNLKLINKLKHRLSIRLDSQTLTPREELYFYNALVREEAVNIQRFKVIPISSTLVNDTRPQSTLPPHQARALLSELNKLEINP